MAKGVQTLESWSSPTENNCFLLGPKWSLSWGSARVWQARSLIFRRSLEFREPSPVLRSHFSLLPLSIAHQFFLYSPSSNPEQNLPCSRDEFPPKARCPCASACLPCLRHIIPVNAWRFHRSLVGGSGSGGCSKQACSIKPSYTLAGPAICWGSKLMTEKVIN